MKITISQEGSNPIILSIPDNSKVKTTEAHVINTNTVKDISKKSTESMSTVDHIFSEALCSDYSH